MKLNDKLLKIKEELELGKRTRGHQNIGRTFHDRYLIDRLALEQSYGTGKAAYYYHDMNYY